MNAPPGRTRYLLPLAYLVVGVAWVVGSDFVLGGGSGLTRGLQLVGTAKGVFFVLASTVLLIVVQAWPRETALPVPLPAKLGEAAIRPLLIFLVTAMGVVLAGFVLYQQQSREVSQRAAESLASTAELTTRQIELWLGERRAGLEFAGRNPLLAHAITERSKPLPDHTPQYLPGALDLLRLSEGFERVQVVSLTDEPIENAGGPVALSERLRFWIRGALVTGRVVMSDLYVPADSVDGKPVIDFVVAVAHDDVSGQVAGVLIARTDPDRYLFPVLAASAGSPQAVSFSLVRRQGDGVAVLLSPALQAGLPGKSSEYAVAAPGAVASQVANGRQGVFDASADGNTPVLATGRAIANTPWFLVATIDKAAVLAPLQRVGRLALLLGTAGLAFAALLVSLWWRSERLAVALQLDAAERRTTMVKEHFAIAGRFVHDIVLLLDDVDATIVEVNDRALDAYGYTREELLARSVFDLRPKGSADEIEARERFKALRATNGGSFVTRHWRKDGSSFPIEISSRVCELDGRQYVQMVGRDITERVEQEARLATLSAERDRVLERLQRQFDDMASACIVISAEGQVLQINPAHQRLFGYGPQDVVGRNIRDFVKSEPFLEEILLCIERLRRDPETQLTGVYQNSTVDHRPITCRWTSTALRDADGNFGGLIGMAEDITEQVVAERALRHSEERYRTLTELSPVGIFRTDLQGHTVFVNSRCSGILGRPAEECLGHGWTRAIHEADAATVARAWQGYIEGGGSTHYAPEFRIVRPNGRIVWVLAQIAPELDLAGQLQGHIGTITDVTAFKTAQLELQQAHDHLEQRVIERTQELEQAKNAAEHSDRVKSAFLSTMSHELRTPLNSILGFTDVLLQGLSGPLNDAQQKQLQIVRDSSNHLRSLIEDVLDISRIEAGQIGLEFTDVDVGDLVARRVEAFGPEAARKGIELRVDVQTALPTIRSDRKRVGQIVNNLLSNAVKFTDQGSVTVEMRAASERIEVVVTDTGVGIPDAARPLLFNPFTQVIRPGGRLHEGTGLGLAISRNLAHALGGDITVTSEAGRGSCFTVWLPRIAEELDGVSASAYFRRPNFRRVNDAV